MKNATTTFAEKLPFDVTKKNLQTRIHTHTLKFINGTIQ